MKSRSSATPSTRRHRPLWTVHPGEILREDFLKPLGMSAYELARQIHVPPPRVNDIVLERRGITADTAVRLARSLGTSPEFWMNAQSLFEVRRALNRIGAGLEQIRPREVVVGS